MLTFVSQLVDFFTISKEHFWIKAYKKKSLYTCLEERKKKEENLMLHKRKT